jgi:hypothetical protein
VCVVDVRSAALHVFGVKREGVVPLHTSTFRDCGSGSCKLPLVISVLRWKEGTRCGGNDQLQTVNNTHSKSLSWPLEYMIQYRLYTLYRVCFIYFFIIHVHCFFFYILCIYSVLPYRQPHTQEKSD